MDSCRVVFLGTGDAFSAGGGHQAAYLVQSPETSVLLDCGPAILPSLNRAALSAASVNTIVLSHFHGDHFAGLPFLFLHYTFVEPRTKPLRIVGPPGVEDRVMLLFGAMYADSAAAGLPYELQFIEARPGRELQLQGATVEAFAVPHQKNPQSYGYAVRCGGRRIVYTGDTGWTENLLIQSEGSDLFICECSFYETRMETHLDYRRIAENLERFGTKRLILTHLGQEVLDRRSELELELAHDGLIVVP